MSKESTRDPREVLAREKFFTLRPQPLERWLWRQGLPPSAERVFWLHWQAGQCNGDWCSAIALKTVAAECSLDVSSVTRAYQLLAALGLIRRQDPGRDPERPFQQAVAITEVRVPRELLQELDRYPNRTPGEIPSAERPSTVAEVPSVAAALTPVSGSPAADPFAGLGGKERRQAMNGLLAHLSAEERRRYDQAWMARRAHMDFDADTRITPEQRASVLWLLALMARKPEAVRPAPPTGLTRPVSTGPRRLSPLELARLRRELQAIAQSTDVDERFREVIWSVEEGALSRFTALHAVRIALKKLREGQWTRPNRMPPQWTRVLSRPRTGVSDRAAAPEPCRAA